MFGFFINLLKRKGNLIVAIESVPPEGYCADGDSIEVSVTNMGQRAVTVTSLMLEFPGTKTLADSAKRSPEGSDTLLPATLAAGELARVSLDLNDVSNRLWKLGARDRCSVYGRCTDAAGSVSRSEPWRFLPGRRPG